MEHIIAAKQTLGQTHGGNVVGHHDWSSAHGTLGGHHHHDLMPTTTLAAVKTIGGGGCTGHATIGGNSHGFSGSGGFECNPGGGHITFGGDAGVHAGGGHAGGSIGGHIGVIW